MVNKKHKKKVLRGNILICKVVDMYNGHDILFEGRAKADSRKAVAELLKNLEYKGVSMPTEYKKV